MVKRRILLIGSNGQIGWELWRCLQPLGQVFALVREPNEHMAAYLDLTDPISIREAVREVKPAVIVNAGAYTAVDKAEQEPELAHAINGIAPGILAEEAHRLSALLVHYSTDYVFDGQHTVPYVEHDTVNPLSVYGTSKLAGEEAIQAVGGHYLILRTAWIYGLRGKNFLLTVQRLARERSELKIVNDQFGAPTWSRLVAETTAQIIAHIYSSLNDREMAGIGGIYHLTCAGQTTWYEFAQAIVAQMERQPQVLPITTAEYPTPAKRPAYSVLANDKLANTFGLTMPAWDVALELCLTSQEG
ncbi:MAG: dTDP-4-dehydrorhamnose reductase [Beggiatoa sp. IS2]|nr:MAG: dTDP-4-dehydrorhamnose reductase [Beggiatoa sp. IS2]